MHGCVVELPENWQIGESDVQDGKSLSFEFWEMKHGPHGESYQTSHNTLDFSSKNFLFRHILL
jgi:hypothetical protein